MKHIIPLFFTVFLSSCSLHEYAKIIYIIPSDGLCDKNSKNITVYQTNSGKRFYHCGILGKIGDIFIVNNPDCVLTSNTDAQIGA